MSSRRNFIKNASLLTGAAGFSTVLPASIQRALAINPDPGTSWEDAEHVVFLMQENRSFDHCFGMLQGVRGFNDPRAIALPNKYPVWLQSNEEGKTYAPFRLDMLNSKSTWMDALPHAWENQVDAWNFGKYNRWLEVKKPGSKDYLHIPMTLGYYTRHDIPFYYALADAFTVCDQHFCSSLTGTTPNRLFFWTGTIRENENSYARVRNSDTDYDDKTQAAWITFPERLQQYNITWKIYQNEISVGGGLNSEEDEWLSNFTDNPIEWFTQYNVKLSETYLAYLETGPALLRKEIEALEIKTAALPASIKKQIEKKRKLLAHLEKEKTIYTREKYNNLSEQQKELQNRAFTTNRADNEYRSLETISFEDGQVQRNLKVPKGDILYQFRSDVETNQLPTVSWLVAPQSFSDHPSSPWYGAWYVSEVLDILTKNPEVWKKTIFILTYDENDGFFDHMLPFTPPHPDKKETGFTSPGISVRKDYVFAHQEATKHKKKDIRESPVGLGFRVPIVIASPWSRGGWVNSEIFDHTSSLQFLEAFLRAKNKRDIKETNISSWRRAVCGNLTSVFRTYNGENIETPVIPEKEAFFKGIYQAKYQGLPAGYISLQKEQIETICRQPLHNEFLPQQETGIRNSCALPYELYVDGNLLGKDKFEIRFAAQNKVFGNKSAGSPFTVFSNEGIRSYAVEPGLVIRDQWPINAEHEAVYEYKVYGPNGFYRWFTGNTNDPALLVNVGYEFKDPARKQLTGKLILSIQTNQKNKTFQVEIIDNAYKGEKKSITINSTQTKQQLKIDTGHSYGWYDISIRVNGFDSFEKRYAGRVETGAHSKTDPLMGKLV